VERCEKLKSTPWVTIHRRPENSQLGIQFVRKWLRKRPCDLCKSGRGSADLQLWYRMFVTLQFKNLEKNCFKPSQKKFKRADTRHPRNVARDAVAACRTAAWYAHAEARLRPLVRAQCLSHCVQVRSTRLKALGRCHVLRPHALDGGTALRHSSDDRCTSPPIPPYPGHTTTVPRLLALVHKESTPPPRVRI
jgi:hypothetical protein